MKRRIALSIEEMNVLKSKGMDISDASMCWVREPNTDTFKLTVHDEYCYELNSLNPVPAYTLEDIILKLSGDISPTNIETMKKYPEVAKPWLFIVGKNNKLSKSIGKFGESPLIAAYNALCEAWDENPKSVKILPKPYIKEVNSGED